MFSKGAIIMAVKGMIRTMLGAAVFITMLATLTPAVGQAAILPAVEQLTGITMGKTLLQGPGRLATGVDGTLYVVDSLKNHILKFDRNGKYVGDISFPFVSAIAVAPNGTLYIGSHKDYSVSIVRNGQVTGYLGAGRNEFQSIRDIAVDPSRSVVYVVDNVGNSVRLFDLNGRDLGTIEGINLPVSIEVTDKEIYIIDAPLVKDVKDITTASRISIFDKDYKVIRTIDEPAGQHLMYRPTDLTVADGIIYVADAALKSVLLFDTSGNFLGEIQSVNGEINTAVSLVISSDGILYVSASEEHRVYMFALTAQAGVGGNPGAGN